MIAEIIHIDQLLSQLYDIFEGDDDLVRYFDPSVVVHTWAECCVAIEKKIRTEYPEAVILLVREDDGKAIGYYVVEDDLLISFGLHLSYRDKEHLTAFWELIKAEFAGSFMCLLYSCNARAISWLQKAGMQILFDNVTILQLCP